MDGYRIRFARQPFAPSGGLEYVHVQHHGRAIKMDAALITGATAIATGLLGYSGARLQHRAEEGRLKVEQDRVGLERVRLEKDSEEARTDRLEQAVEAKRALYCEFLKNAEMPWSFCMRHVAVTVTEVDEWWVAYQGVRRQLIMVATEDVLEKSYLVNDRIADVFVDLIQAIREGGDVGKVHGKRVDTWAKHCDSVESSRQELEEAMRGDVAL